MAHLDVEKSQRIVNSSVFCEIPELLESSNADIRLESVKLITALAYGQESLVAPVDVLNRIAERLGSLLGDKNTGTVESATELLVRIALWSLHNRAMGWHLSDAAPLTDQMVLDICSSHLRCVQSSSWLAIDSRHISRSRYVASGTKVTILHHLRSYFARVEIGACSIVSSSTFLQLPQLLDSSNAQIKMETARLITVLTSHGSFVAPIGVLHQAVEKLKLTLKTKTWSKKCSTR
ncbi:hypothetical protein FB45DRAFT_914599 [Roridomyces roridus]|uniref:Uncharacterized protein n=1 Tax=Roridomyces roridus TaxID=1738132 RepID=A0AAD7FMX8_9AGAR|nr:hypothetical protein FB45DRAFT_914599 [Roridomyces roridus]